MPLKDRYHNTWCRDIVPVGVRCFFKDTVERIVGFSLHVGHQWAIATPCTAHLGMVKGLTLIREKTHFRQGLNTALQSDNIWRGTLLIKKKTKKTFLNISFKIEHHSSSSYLSMLHHCVQLHWLRFPWRHFSFSPEGFFSFKLAECRA